MKTIEMLLENYATSINNGDLYLADKLFLQNENTSFIHSRGHEVGFNNIKEVFYVKTMINRFSKRDLKIHNIKINLLTDNTVVVEFYWDFYATFREDNTDIITNGRESQTLIKANDKWKIAHIHYSNMPVTGDKEGF